jgi:hypothetical protein
VPVLTLGEVEMVAIAVVAALFGGLLRGFAGMGGPAIMLLALTQFYSPASVLGKVLIIDIVANAWLIPSVRREIQWRKALIIIGVTVLAMPLGIYALVVVDPLVMKRIIAAIAGVAAVGLLLGWRYRSQPGVAVLGGAGIVSGVVLGATYLGLPTLLFLHAGPDPARVSRANGILWGFLTSCAMIPALVAIDALTWTDVWRSLLVGLPYLALTWFGARIFRGIAEAAFRRAVLWLFLVLAAIGVFT